MARTQAHKARALRLSWRPVAHLLIGEIAFRIPNERPDYSLTRDNKRAIKLVRCRKKIEISIQVQVVLVVKLHSSETFNGDLYILHFLRLYVHIPCMTTEGIVLLTWNTWKVPST